jgi:BioD-like phosphotransacetylase family protein
LVLSGRDYPSKNLLTLFKKKNIPVLLSHTDTYNTTSILNNINVKIRPKDKEKIEIVKYLINKYVNIERILEKI